MACKNKGKQGRENKKRCLLRSVYNLIQNATSPYTQLRLGPRLLEETPSIATGKQGYASIRQYSRFSQAYSASDVRFENAWGDFCVDFQEVEAASVSDIGRI